MSAQEGYCRNGIHYIGDATTCVKCDLMATHSYRRRFYHGHLQAELLRSYLECQ